MSELIAPSGRVFDPNCQICTRLAEYLKSVRTRFPDYHARPVAAFGPRDARMLIVGLAPGLRGANRTGRPFTGDASGDLLFSTLHVLGLASAPRATSAHDAMRLINCRITNAVRCVPPLNRPNASELSNCRGFLAYDFELLYRGGRRRSAVAVVALGHLAHRAALEVLGARLRDWPFSHGAVHEIRPRLALVDSYHPSRQNTQTGRLTPEMFHAALDAALRFIG